MPDGDKKGLVHTLIDDAKAQLTSGKHNHEKTAAGVYDHARAVAKGRWPICAGTSVTVPDTLKLRRDSRVDFEVPEKLRSRAPLSSLTKTNRTGRRRGSSGGVARSQPDRNTNATAIAGQTKCLRILTPTIFHESSNLVRHCIALTRR